MTTAQQVLDVARSQIGVQESPSGSNNVRYNSWYYDRPVSGATYPWCAVFQSWCAAQAKATDIIPRHAYTPTGAGWFQQRGQWSKTPRVGSLVYYHWTGMNRISHVGIVEAVYRDGSWVAIEGNTDAAGGRTGGRVMRQRRTTVGKLGGFGHPAYTAVGTPSVPSAPAPAAPSAPAGDGWPLPAGQYFGASNVYPSNDGRDSDRERDVVAEFQDQLRRLGYDIGESGPDGSFGQDTRAATLAWQARNLGGPQNIITSGLCGWNDYQAIHTYARTPAAGATPPAVSTPYPGSPLQQGDSGPNVQRMQVQLARRVPGFDYSSAPGTFGPRTTSAVLTFQRAQGIVDDAVVGATTWRLLFAAG